MNEIRNIREIVKLGKKTIAELRKLNPHGAYSGKELNRWQLIYQIVYLADAPDDKEK